jgi:serine/threonine-protein kinase
MTDEITTRLGYIHGLAVISRQSAIVFKRMGISPQLADDFNLDYFLEGTFQCERPSDPNSEVRIRIQLVKAADNAQVWQKPFDGNMDNIFSLQSDIAEKVDITLLEPERKALTHGYTDNAEAYACLLQGHKNITGWTKEGNIKAIEMYEKAIDLDPNYARAHASLSDALTQMYWFHGRNRELLPRAKEEADTAINLAPDLAGAHVALGRYYYQGCFDYEKALEEFAIVRRSYPNHVGVLYWTGCALQRQGKFEQALDNFKRACELHPTSTRCLYDTAKSCALLRRYEESERYCKLAIGLAPDTMRYYARLAWTYLEWRGDTEQARKALNEALLNMKEGAKDEGIYYALVLIDVYEGKYSEALEKLASGLGDIDNMALFVPEELRRAEIHGYMGNEELKQQYYRAAVDILERKVEEYPDADRFRSTLGKAYAGVGRKEDAILQGELGTKYLPMEKDMIIGPIRIEELAHIYVMVEEFDKAIDQIAFLLEGPTEYTVHLFEIDPAWDPLRNHPRFKKLIEADK